MRGSGVMKGYCGDPKSTVAALVDEWLLTGDVARQDTDGFVWLVVCHICL